MSSIPAPGTTPYYSKSENISPDDSLHKDKDQIVPYKIQFSAAKLADLKARLDLARYPEPLAGHDEKNAMGMDLDELRVLVQYWKNDFNWAAREEMLNELSQFRTVIDDVDMHFIHVKSSYPDAMPLVMIHGWPSTNFDFYKVIPQLTDPAKFGRDPTYAFNVVAPALPGFGLSKTSPQFKIGAREAAVIIAKLMRRLGYKKFMVFGCDWGSAVANFVAQFEEKQGEDNRIVGLVLNGMIAVPQFSWWTPITNVKNVLSFMFPSLFYNEYEREMLKYQYEVYTHEIGYLTQSITKPLTLGTVLHNSPVAVAAWLAEKYIAWTDASGIVIAPGTDDKKRMDMIKQKHDFSRHTLSHSISIDELLTTIMLYWMTDSITSSVAFYHNTLDLTKPTDIFLSMGTNTTPVFVSEFAVDIMWAPQSWAHQQYKNVKKYCFHDNGGHFAAMEQPDELVNDFAVYRDIISGENAKPSMGVLNRKVE
uniref:Epoxide hydrolase N-terminal domain-containing protein n=1 Tax=Spongospora subterranea TaxID=70186 RepID=A0A0H5RKV1_9EUKA|eukprot:CRZ09344.1 hypothetical protein [Spongospora subterranea]